MMDAHMVFQDQWDVKIMDNWNELEDEMAIITTYPHGYVLRTDNFPTGSNVNLCSSTFMEDLKIPRHQVLCLSLDRVYLRYLYYICRYMYMYNRVRERERKREIWKRDMEEGGGKSWIDTGGDVRWSIRSNFF